MVGFYDEVCTKKGRQGAILRCDILGRRMETDNAGYVTTFDKDGNDITTILHNAEDQRLGTEG